MIRSLTCAQARWFDQLASERFGIPSLLLMENAGHGLADLLLTMIGWPPEVTICCGKGNNGGDGLVLARHLDARGIEVAVLIAAERSQIVGDARVNLDIVERSGLSLVWCPNAADVTPEITARLAECAYVVDALLGTGSQGPPRGSVAAMIRALNTVSTPCLAVDLPSGLDADTGPVNEPTVRATHTATLVAPKPGLLVPRAAAYVGQLHVVSLGTPARLLDEALGCAES